eukprot:TRINITY_DN940_c0_g2_i4.p1 TRINITY_DN940_c0_g2~~TRINITY_DN940_c0_g2_i4.p1  ORF type:complete len:2437 (+),score=543.61 TRINITY_DN940_c0_g2_i4:265-7575(+)
MLRILLWLSLSSAALAVCGNSAAPALDIRMGQNYTTEGGVSSLISIQLCARPTANLTIPLISSNPAEGIPAVPFVLATMTEETWNETHYVDILGVNDFYDDGDKSFEITIGPITTPSNYQGMKGPTLKFTNQDDDESGITVTPTTASFTEGESGSFDVVLTSIPHGPVTVNGFFSNDTTELALTGATSVTFQPSNWNVSQTITFDALTDLSEADRDQIAIVQAGKSQSTDDKYNGLTLDTVTITVVDGDTEGAVILPTCGINVAEDPTLDAQLYMQHEFTIVLQSRPTAPVTFQIESNNVGEGYPHVDSVTFQRDEWNVEKTITVKAGADDMGLADGDQIFEIEVGKTTSGDPFYNDKFGDTITCQSLDDDAEVIHIFPLCGTTSEDGSKTETLNLLLSKKPSADVTVPIKSNNQSEGVVSPQSVLFTPSDWSDLHTVEVYGVDDYYDDGDIIYFTQTGPSSSTDAAWNGLTARNEVNLTNVNDDLHGFTRTETCEVTEAAMDVFTLEVSLSSMPWWDVTVTLSPVNTKNDTLSVDSELIILEPLPPYKLYFTDKDWNISQTVKVQGLDEWIDDDDQMIQIRLLGESHDPMYQDYKLNGDYDGTTCTVKDNDTATLSVKWSKDEHVANGQFDGVHLWTSEEAQNGTTFELSLTSQPLETVVIKTSMEVYGTRMLPNGTYSATFEGQFLPSEMTFTPLDWNVSQQMEYKAIDDVMDDGTQTILVTIATNSTDPKYACDESCASVSSYPGTDTSFMMFVKNTDNDNGSFVIDPSSTFETDENGNTATIGLKLATMPVCYADDNCIWILIDRDPSTATEGIITPIQLAFNDKNWDTYQYITVTGVDDDIADGDQTYPFVIAGSNWGWPDYSRYHGYNYTVNITNKDNDIPGISINTTSRVVSEDLTSVDIWLNLQTVPTADVTIQVSLNDSTEASSSPASLTFSPANFHEPQKVVITGVDDDLVDGDITFTVTFAVSSTDSAYGSLTDIELTNFINEDNDEPGFNIDDPTNTIVVTEDGTSKSVGIRLNGKPTSDVVMSTPVVTTSSPNEEASVSSGFPMTFTADNWDVYQYFDIVGKDDPAKDGDQPFTVGFDVQSADPLYSSLPAASRSISGLNLDNDSPGLLITGVLRTSEANNTNKTSIAEVIMRTQPTADVSVSLTVNNTNEASLNTSSLLFTASDWRTPRYIEVTGVDDDLFDGDQPYAVSFQATSNDQEYQQLFNNLDPIIGINADNETDPCSEFGGKCANTANGCSVCCAASCGVCKLDCTPQSMDPCCAEKIDTDNNACTIDSGAPCVIKPPPTSAPCSKYGGICKDATCRVCCPAQCGVCGGPDCSGNCCEQPIIGGGNVCNDQSNAPCIRLDVCQNVVCTASDSCHEVGVCDFKTGKCTDPPKPSNTSCTTATITSGTCSENGVCVPSDITCGVGSCPGSPDSCSVVGCDGDTCSTSRVVPAVDCNDGDSLTQNDTCVEGVCTGQSPCSDFGGICADSKCTVCCDKSCGVCGGPDCTGSCCETPITEGEKFCSDTQPAPCLRIPSKCDAYAGVCSDRSCTHCCASSCGDKCGAPDCASAPGGASACCPGTFEPDQKFCDDYTHAPCLRATKCDKFGGICKDTECTVCCDKQCGSCGSENCADLPGGAARCCIEEIMKANNTCSVTVYPAPCVTEPDPVPPSPCAVYGGICTDQDCTACCDLSCGNTCGQANCTDLCCHPVITDGGSKCTVNSGSPCVRVNECLQMGGICNDDNCNICCDSTCGECGGNQCLPGGSSSCCDIDIATQNPKPCIITTANPSPAPCVRVDKCTSYGGYCSDADCTVCCSKSCETCTTSNTDPTCNPTDINKGSSFCTSNPNSGSCIRVSKCEVYGGICQDESCAVCCSGQCGVCGGPTCASDPAGSDKCCPESIQNNQNQSYCSNTTSAPCIRSSKCSDFGGICKDDLCTVCCSPECSTCGDCSLDDRGSCCEATIAKDGQQCSATVSAPCVRASTPCLAYGGICSDALCTSCCHEDCQICGGPTCHLDPLGASSCCPKTIEAAGEHCSPSPNFVRSPCIRENKCASVGGVCNDASCSVCCNSGCDDCGGLSCSTDPLGASQCCVEEIMNADPRMECSQEGSTAPCIRQDLCGSVNGICADERCAVCCDEKCGACGGPTCSLDPLGASKCCIDEITQNQGTCTAGDAPAAPCIRLDACEPFGGICRDESCAVCCDKSCGVCGGSECAARTGLCCVDRIVETDKYCGPGVQAPCIRTNLCQAFGGICKDDACAVCCDRECGTCDDVGCEYATQNGTARCCAAGITTPCGDQSNAPCLRAAGNGDDDDDDFPWWIILIIVGVILCCCLILLCIFLKKRKKEEDDKRNQNMFSLEEQRGGLHSTLIMAEREEQGDEMSEKQNGKGNSTSSPKTDKLEGTTTSASPPSRTRKRPGRMSTVKKSEDNGNTDYDDML